MTNEITNDAVDMATSATGEQSENSQGNFFSNVGDNPTDDNSTGDNPVDSKATKSGKGKGRKPKVEPKQTVSTEVTPTDGDKPKKRKQLSVYITYEAYNVLLSMSSKTHEPVPDMIAKAAENLAKKNLEKARLIEEVLQGIEDIEY